MEAQGYKSNHLDSLDPALFSPTEDHAKFIEHYRCKICLGVVIKPRECSTCATLYCEKCVNGLIRVECPNRCGSKTFKAPHRHVMNQLNEFRFKCQNQPMCLEIIPYQIYERHFAECNQPPCENPKCKALKQQVIE